jgi:hypothetical protein
VTKIEPCPPPDWTAPEPRQIPVLREHMIEQLRNPYERAAQVGLLRAGKGTVNPCQEDPELAADVLLGEEIRRLSAAQLWVMTPEMTAFARQAGTTLPDWNLRREDLPCTAGLAVFGEPMGQYIKEDDPAVGRATVSIVAVSWGPTDLGTDSNLWVTFWSATNFETQIAALRQFGGMSLAEARDLSYQIRGELTWDNEIMANFDAEGIFTNDDNQVWLPIDPTGDHVATQTSAPWLNTLRAAWLLMKQPKMTETTEVPQPKPVQRRALREHIDTSPVRVVHVHAQRRARRQAAARASGYTQTVQYPVSGHWREQPYPSRGTTERIFIDEHIRGPKDAPFRAGPSYTVNVVDRPPRNP